MCYRQFTLYTYRGGKKAGRPRRGRMLTTEALHVSETANFKGRMLTGPARPGPVTSGPGPMVFQNYRAWPGPCRALIGTHGLRAQIKN